MTAIKRNPEYISARLDRTLKRETNLIKNLIDKPTHSKIMRLYQSRNFVRRLRAQMQ